MRITNRRWLGLVAISAALLLLLPACVTPAACASKDRQYALVFGTVWGAEKRPVYGVRIKVRRANETKFRWDAVSDHRGEFGIRLPAAKADYVLVPDLKYAKDKPLPETRIHVENDERVDIGVHLEE